MSKEKETEDENIFELEEIKEEIANYDTSIALEEPPIEEEDELADPFDLKFTESINKHKIEGIHRLQKDVIFNPEISSSDPNEELTEDSVELDEDYDVQGNENYNDIYTHIHGVNQEFDGFITNVELSTDVYELLKSKTKIDLTSNRRKPNKATFNSYYEMLTIELRNKYSKAEIFVELTHYFTDNLFNGFKLLEKKYATGIIMEMKNKGYLRDIGDINFV